MRLSPFNNVDLSARSAVGLASALALLAGCAVGAPIARPPVAAGASLVLNPPKTWTGQRTLQGTQLGGTVALDGRYTRADVDHLEVELATTGVAPITVNVPEERLDEPLNIQHLRANTTYRVTVRAYRTPGSTTANQISQATGSSVDASTSDDNVGWAGSPTVATLRVLLADRKPYVAEPVAVNWVASRLVAADASTIYAATGEEIKRVVLDAALVPTVTSLASLGAPSALALDPTSQTLYYADSQFHKLGKLALPAGAPTPLTNFVSAGGNGTEAPGGLCFEATSNTLLYADGVRQVVQRFDLGSGTLTRLFGQLDRSEQTDGTLATAALADPGALAVGRDGTIYVAQSATAALREADASFVRTLLRDPFEGVAADGPAGSAALAGAIQDLALDPNGNLWFLDGSGVRRLDREGRVGTLSAIGEDGQVTSLAGATAIAVAPDGTLFVSSSTDLYRVR
ncbi:MAG: uncharacterized protein JWM80_1203 [Cyanobacteria bacterium RYN_339]|nr:uncharacterized protein [Cyanobacteria bacterium RYN_339]